MSATATAPVLPIRRGVRLYVDLATEPEDLRAAQALRYQVFAEEMGARLKGPEPGLDVDDFDAHCQHLMPTASIYWCASPTRDGWWAAPAF